MSPFQTNGVYIIAEAGVNHNGDMDRAFQMIDKAVEMGADAVKFQAWKAENLASKFAGKADYQKVTTDPGENQLEMLRTFELQYDQEIELQNYCGEKGIQFLCSPFDMESIDFLDSIGLKTFKVPSGEITNLPYLRKLGALGSEIILSTGMATFAEVESALDILVDAGTPKDNIILLHCNTEYPTPFEDVNLRAMMPLGEKLGVRVGYSDHTPGIEVSVAAVGMGATVIEKHFTLDQNLPGPDHKASLEPQDFKALVDAIRNVETAMGSTEKSPSPSESKNIVIARKSIVAAVPIKKGEMLDEGNLRVKRPGSGISPMRWDEVLGTTATRDFEEDELIELD